MTARLPTAGFAQNRQVADRLRETAELLRVQGANPYRANAYRRAAEAIEGLARNVREVFEAEGLRGLDAIPGVGLGIATAVAEMLSTGRWGQLERLRGTIDPETLFQEVPGLGPELARRIHDRLHIDSLEALENAANDGSLDEVPGVGPRRLAAWRAALDGMLGRVRRIRDRFPGDRPREPGVAALLDVDREYREKALAGKLHTIAPRRFNPDNTPWLPVLHTQHGEWHFTALYSNSALAHKLDRTRDWVIIYLYAGDGVERQRTVVTETRGPLEGLRVVRGREGACHEHYLHPPNGTDKQAATHEE